MSNLPFNYRKQRLPQMEAGVFCRNLSYFKKRPGIYCSDEGFGEGL